MNSGNSAEQINTEIYRAAVKPILHNPVDPEQIMLIERYLEKIEMIIALLKSDRIDTAEAIRMLRELSPGGTAEK